MYVDFEDACYEIFMLKSKILMTLSLLYHFSTFIAKNCGDFLYKLPITGR